jgi:hypothetical protein
MAPELWLPQSGGKVDMSEKDHEHPMRNNYWFEPYNNRREQEVVANQILGLIRSRCTNLYSSGRINENKWTNDPLVFPLEEHELKLPTGVSGIVPFPPNDQQYYICGIYDAQLSYLKPSAKPGHDMYSEGHGESNSSWMRVCDFNHHDGAVNLFQERGQKGYHFGRLCKARWTMGTSWRLSMQSR